MPLDHVGKLHEPSFSVYRIGAGIGCHQWVFPCGSAPERRSRRIARALRLHLTSETKLGGIQESQEFAGSLQMISVCRFRSVCGHGTSKYGNYFLMDHYPRGFMSGHIDDKGRLKLPTVFQSFLSERAPLIVAYREREPLSVYPEEIWKRSGGVGFAGVQRWGARGRAVRIRGRNPVCGPSVP